MVTSQIVDLAQQSKLVFFCCERLFQLLSRLSENYKYRNRDKFATYYYYIFTAIIYTFIKKVVGFAKILFLHLLFTIIRELLLIIIEFHYISIQEIKADYMATNHVSFVTSSQTACACCVRLCVIIILITTVTVFPQ